MDIKYRKEHKKEGPELHLSVQKYVELSLIVILLLTLMLFIINIESFLRAAEAKVVRKNYVNLEERNSFEIPNTEERFIVIGDESFIADGLNNANIAYRVIPTLGEVKNVDGNLILEGYMIKSSADVEVLNKFIEAKKSIIFLSLPDEKQIRDYDLKKVLGIDEVLGKKDEKQLTLVPGFILGGLHEFSKMNYEIYNLKLSFSTKVFAYGKDDSPVIWRNTYEDSEIYTVNGPFMDTNVGYGFLAALLCEINEDYIYPVVNARFMTYEGLPFISDVNKKNLEKLYNRNAMKFQKDILLSNILTINSTRNFVPNGYFTLGFEQSYKQSIDVQTRKLLEDVSTQIYNSGGQIGVRYSGDIESDKVVYHDLFKNQRIKSIIVDEDFDDLKNIIDSTESLESVVGPWKRVDSFEFVNKRVVYIPFTVDGFENIPEKELELLSGVMAFGAIVQNMSVEDFVLWKGESENFTKSSRVYMKGIDKYRDRFKFLQDKNIIQTANSVKIFRNNHPDIHRSPDKITIDFENWYGDSHFIFKTEKDIIKITNGKVQKIEDGFYLLTATKENVVISLSESKNKEVSR